MQGYLLDAKFVSDLKEVLQFFKKNGLRQHKPRHGTTSSDAASVLVKNTESVVVPPYACMQVDGAVDEDGQNYIKIKKPASGGLLYLFNGHYEIEASGYGCAQNGPVFRVYKDTGTVTLGDRWAPTSGQWYLTKGFGQFTVVGADDIAAGCFRVMLTDFGTLMHFKAPAGGIPAFNTGTSTMGSASCTTYTSSTSGVLSSGSSVTVYNAAGAVAANAWGIAMRNDAGLWVVIVERC